MKRKELRESLERERKEHDWFEREKRLRNLPQTIGDKLNTPYAVVLAAVVSGLAVVAAWLS